MNFDDLIGDDLSDEELMMLPIKGLPNKPANVSEGP
jgi:hypothetical protein